MPTEREVKLGVWPGFTLPELSDIAEGIEAARASDQRLEAVYHDTTDLRLARQRITLRHRTGEGAPCWTVKLPGELQGDALVREEIDVPGDAKTVPAEIRAHLVAWVRTAPLHPVARLQTLRSRVVLRDADGKPLAEIVDDEVSVLEHRRVALRFREVEVELGAEGDDAILDETVSRLRAAGAGAPDPTPKVMRALGPKAAAAPDLQIEPVPREATAGDVLRAGLTRAVLRVLQHDAAVRLGDDHEAVHQARVGTRRLRSDLRTFSPLLDSTWSEPLRAELTWLADMLGEVRDRDVLSARLERDIAALEPADIPPGKIVLEELQRERDDARAALREAMDSDRYVLLLEQLVAAARDPVVLPEAASPAQELLPALVRRPWTALTKGVKKAGDDAPDEVLHGIRIRAKRARYASDVAALVVGKRAVRFSDAMTSLQDVLGEHQDACVRRAWLRDTAATMDPTAGLVVGQLIAMATIDVEHGRVAWQEAWKHANKGRLRTWLKP